jgi:rod shape determining protein RodA
MKNRFSLLPDLAITAPIILIICLSVLVLYSSDPSLALQQAIFAIVGLIIYGFLSLLNFEFIERSIYPSLIFVVILLIFTYIIGLETRGSIRWIPIGPIHFQPSELAKPIIALSLALFWKTRETSWKNLIISFLIISPSLFLIFKQPDLGTTLTILAIWVFGLIGANLSTIKFFILGLFGVAMVPVLNLFLKDYQKDRLLNFLSPTMDPLGAGYNVIQSTIAVGSGQLMGRGLGHGTQSRLQFLPEFKTDFMFASVAEEFGLLGTGMILVLYGILLFRGLKIILNTKSRFYQVLVFSSLGLIFFQTVVNIGMNIGIMPVTGITLPLISYGGSSMISTLIMLSFITSASRNS